MTTRSDPFPLALSGTSGFAWRRLFFSFFVTLLAIVLFAVAFALGYARLHESRVLPGVEVGGVALGGLDRAAAEAKLREDLPILSSGVLTVRYADVEEEIRYSEIGRDYDINLMLDQAFEVGRDGDVAGQVLEQLRVLMRGVSVEPSMTWNSEALAERVRSVGEQALIEPVDARVTRQGGAYVVEPSVVGRTVDIESGVALANTVVNNLSADDTAVAVEPVAVPPQVTTEQAQAAVDRYEAIVGSALAITGGGSTTTVDGETLRGWVMLQEQAVGQWTIAIAHDPIRQLVTTHAAEVDVPAKNATFAFEGDAVVAVPGDTGQSVDVDASTASVLQTLESRADGGGTGPVSLAVVTTEPEFTTQEAREIAPRVEMLSRWHTNYSPGALNYGGRNITIPTNEIDGYVVEPGATFDFLDVIGPITPERGYGYGAAIIQGRTRLGEDGALGGGMCSCSTTVFNAAARAGLEIGHRRNHTYYINRYPLGLDATVWIASATQRQTVSFTNDMEYAVLIRGINRPGRVIFEVWGVPDGRTVSFSDPDVTMKPRPVEKIQYVNSLRPGQRKRVEFPIQGMKVTVIRTVRDADGNVIHRDTFRSNYKTINGITQLGRRPGDPPAGTMVNASQVPRGGGGNGGGGNGGNSGGDE